MSSIKRKIKLKLKNRLVRVAVRYRSTLSSVGVLVTFSSLAAAGTESLRGLGLLGYHLNPIR